MKQIGWRAWAMAALMVASVSVGLTHPAEWNEPIAPFHIIGNVYYVGTKGIGVYLITTPQGHFLLDGALAESAPQIERNVALLGFKMTDVRYLLNTHAHYDHSGGLYKLKQVSGAEMISSQGDKPDLESGLTESFGAEWDQRGQGVKVDRVVQDGETITLGGVHMTAHLTPGHTRGCTTWSLPVREHGNTYQVVYYGSTSVPGYPLLHNRLYPGIVADYRHSFAVLHGMRCDVFLGNHTESFHLDEKLAARQKTAANPFIRPDEMQSFVAESEQEFNQKLAQQQAAAAHPAEHKNKPESSR